MSDNMSLNAMIGVDASAAISALKASERAVKEMAAEFENASGAVKEHTQGLATAARAIKTATDAISNSRVAAAKVDETTSRAQMNRRKTEIMSEEAAARAVVRAEQDKTTARKRAEQEARRNSTRTGNPAADPSKLVARNLSGTLGPDSTQTAELKAMGDFYRKQEVARVAATQQALRQVEGAEKASNDRRIADNKRRAEAVFAITTKEVADQERLASQASRIRVAAETADKQRIAENRRRAQEVFSLAPDAGNRQKQSAASNKQMLVDEAAANKARIAANRARAQDVFGLPDVGTINQTRYALYDVATTLGVLGTAMTAAGGAAMAFGVQYESAFTNIERTNIGSPTKDIADLRGALLGLSERIPVNFQDLTEIGTIGSQLGIATKDIEKFTETTAKFAAVTNVSTEQAGMGFGALSNLLKVPAQDFDKLGSAIGATGVESVATEAEILSLSTAIGATATQANFGAAETVGLASALASLRIQPEQARGVLLRLFADFDEAVSLGGENLKGFADVMGVTTKEAEALWKSSDGSEKFFDALIKGLSASEDLNGTLRDLGIKETRERNVLQRLAGSYDLYADSIRLAQDSFEAGTFLDESYGLIADDVATKLTILANTLANLAAKAGDALLPVLGPLLDILTAIAQFAGHIPAPILGMVAALAGVVGVATLLVAGFATMVASGYALQSALVGIQRNSAGAATVGQALRQTITQTTAAMGLNTAAAKVNSFTIGGLAAAVRAKTGALTGNTTALATNASAMGATGAAAGGAAVATRGFGAALMALPVANVVFGLLTIIPLALSAVSAFSGMGDAARESGKKLLEAGGGVESFRATLTDVGSAGALGTITMTTKEMSEEMRKAQEEAAAYASRLDIITGTTDNTTAAVDRSTTAIKERTLALTEDSAAWFQNALKQNAGENGLGNIAADPTLLAKSQTYGIDISKAIADGMRAGSDGPGAELERQLVEARRRAAEQHANDDSVESLINQSQVEKMAREFDKVRDALNAAMDEVRVDDVTNQLLGMDEATKDTADSVEILGSAIEEAFASMDIETNFLNSMDALNAAIEDNGIHFDNLSAGGRANLSALSESLQAAAAYGEQLGISTEESMARALLEVNSGAISTAQLLQQISALPATFRAKLDISGVIDQVNRLAAMGIGTGAGKQMSVKAKQSEVNRLTSQRDKLVAQQSKGGGGGGGRKPKSGGGGGTKKAAKEAKDSLKSVAEYARDMGTAMQQAFDSRFGLARSMDEVASKFNSMAKTIQDAKDKVRDLHNELSQLAADRSILEAQLKVAIDYGDELRADAIRAELAKKTATVSDKTKGLAEANARATMQIEGNTQAAIDNRNAVYGLISAYQGQIQAYAETGASADQVSAYTKVLQGQFIQQLTQLGLNSSAVNHFASVFDSLSASVRAVPTHKEVTITARTEGAEGRIASLAGSVRNLDGDIARLNREIDAASANAAAAGNRQIQANALMRQASDRRIQAATYGASALPGMRDSLYAQAEELERRARALRYAKGGVIGGGGRPANRGVDDTLIWAQKGEGVVKQQSMEWLGADGLKAINNMQNPFPQATVVQQAQPNYGSSTLVVELSAYDRSVQQQIADRVGVTIGSDTIASATNRHNGRLAKRGGS